MSLFCFDLLSPTSFYPSIHSFPPAYQRILSDFSEYCIKRDIQLYVLLGIVNTGLDTDNALHFKHACL